MMVSPRRSRRVPALPEHDEKPGAAEPQKLREALTDGDRPGRHQQRIARGQCGAARAQLFPSGYWAHAAGRGRAAPRRRARQAAPGRGRPARPRPDGGGGQRALLRRASRGHPAAARGGRREADGDRARAHPAVSRFVGGQSDMYFSNGRARPTPPDGATLLSKQGTLNPGGSAPPRSTGSRWRACPPPTGPAGAGVPADWGPRQMVDALSQIVDLQRHQHLRVAGAGGQPEVHRQQRLFGPAGSDGQQVTRMIARRPLALSPGLHRQPGGVGLVLLVPGDPALAIAGDNATPEQVAAIRGQARPRRPGRRAVRAVAGRGLQGDLGTSLFTGYRVSTPCAARLRSTLSLVAVAFVLAALVGCFPSASSPPAARAAVVDRVLTITTSVGLAMPNFWLGLLLVTFFGLKLAGLPATATSRSGRPVGWARASVLPALTLADRGGRRDHPADALRAGRRPRPGLHAHAPGEGPVVGHDHPPHAPEERRGPGRHRRRPAGRPPVRRRDDRGEHLRLTGVGSSRSRRPRARRPR